MSNPPCDALSATERAFESFVTSPLVEAVQGQEWDERRSAHRGVVGHDARALLAESYGRMHARGTPGRDQRGHQGDAE